MGVGHIHLYPRPFTLTHFSTYIRENSLPEVKSPSLSSVEKAHRDQHRLLLWSTRAPCNCPSRLGKPHPLASFLQLAEYLSWPSSSLCPVQHTYFQGLALTPVLEEALSDCCSPLPSSSPASQQVFNSSHVLCLGVCMQGYCCPSIGVLLAWAS